MEPLTVGGAARGIAALAGELERKGSLTSERWREALASVPRHLFVPPRAWLVPGDPRCAARGIDSAKDPVAWQKAVYSDSSIVIQADDGAGDPATGRGLYSSSVSAPSAVIEFLELLDPQPGDRVLEVGTGSGWTAALLCHVAGEDQVTTVEVDPVLAAAAAASLRSAGFAPRVLSGDGALGHLAGAPYDRVHVTCAVSRIPAAWVAQTRPGGVIVLPWSPVGGNGCKLRLTVTGDLTATGSFRGPATYMMMRAQRLPASWNPHHSSEAERTTTALDPRSIADAGEGAHLAITARLPGIGWHVIREPGGATSGLLFEAGNPDGSWAACDHETGAADSAVTQFGPRRLWDETETAYNAWLDNGAPGAERYGITIDPGSSHIWIDDPSHVIGSISS